jgi:hypothetical protein
MTRAVGVWVSAKRRVFVSKRESGKEIFVLKPGFWEK